MDGGSTDGTVEILREYGERYPDRFRWVSEPDKGQSDALNKGIALAKGEFIGWQNSDDYYYPNVFAEPIQHLIDHPDVAAVFSGCHIVDVEGKVHRSFHVTPFDFERLIEGNYIPNQSAFIRKDRLVELGGLDQCLQYVMDLDLWLRLGLKYQITYVPGIRGAWRIHPDAKSSTGLPRPAIEQITVCRRILDDPELPPQLAAIVVKSLQRQLGMTLLRLWACNDAPGSEEALKLALSYGPLPYKLMLNALLQWLIDPRGEFRAPEESTYSAIPNRIVSMIAEDNPGGKAVARDAEALADLYRALDPAHPTGKGESLAYLTRAVLSSRWWISSRGVQVVILRRFLGDRAVNLLRSSARLVRRSSSKNMPLPK
jgi:glycosyltransferase involved in cell wall biosynthesis